MKRFFIFCTCLLCSSVTKSVQLSLDLQSEQDHQRNFTVTVQQEKDEYTYFDTVRVYASSPSVAVVSWKIDADTQELFDARFHENKKVLKDTFKIIGVLQESAPDNHAALIVGLLTNLQQAPEFKAFELTQKNEQQVITHESTLAVTVAAPVANVPVTCSAPHQKRGALSDYVQRLLATTTYFWVKLILALLLGILMSLTPCIYPMIPITVSILQGQGQRSLFYSFFLAFSYTLGIALMFAVLGLSAALTGAFFGSLMSKPIVIIAIVLMLAYFGLSMFGLYEIRLPSWFKRSADTRPTGSLVSAFVFGVLSGTVASPCLSPGLAFLLSIVATLGSKLLGFALLFMFGVGMSIPLLLIGTITPALRFMPKSGLWMVEVKKIFGILLFALCFYYMSNILSVTLLLWLIASSLLPFALYTLFTLSIYASLTARIVRMILGVGGLIGSVLLYIMAIQRTIVPTEQRTLVNWRPNYIAALQEARAVNKLLFVDVGASYCSICTAIDRCILNDAYIASLLNATIPVHIDAGTSPEFGALSKQFSILGVPVLLVIDQKTESVIQRWGAEFYSLTKPEVGMQLGSLLQEHAS